MKDLKVGDIVTFKAGGPLCNVTGIYPDGSVQLLYFSDVNDAKTIDEVSVNCLLERSESE